MGKRHFGESPDDHSDNCPLCSERPSPEVLRLRILLQACRPTACPPALKERIVREVRFVAFAITEIDMADEREGSEEL